MRSRLPLVAVFVLLLGCSRSPSDVREWKPSDHDQPERPAEPRQHGAASPRGHPPASGVAPDAFALWSRHCVLCHGTVGRGDGPQGKAFGAKDLTDPGWQESTTDAQIAQVISKGRGKMPVFDFDPASVQGLVKLLRRMRSNQPAAPAQSPSAGRSAATDAESSD